jgi:predicted PurR-regulated permease PerM
MDPQWLLVVFAVLAGFYFASGVLIPLVISFFLAVLLEPMVAWGESRGLRRNRSAALFVSAFFLLAVGAAWACSQPFSRIAADMSQYSSRIRAVASAVDRRTTTFEKDAEEVKKALRPGRSAAAPAPAPAAAPAPAVADGFASWQEFVWRGLGSFFEIAGIAVFVPFLMVFGLGEKELLCGALHRLYGASCDVGLIQRETPKMIRAYFYGSVAVGLLMAVLHWGLFEAMGLENAAGLSLVAGACTLLPLIGLPAALILPMAQGVLQFDRVLPCVVLACGVTSLHLIAANFALPRVIGERVKINATAATASLLFWGWLWGVTGVLLAVPLTALLKIVLESGKGTAAYAGLLAVREREPRVWFGRRWFAARRRTAVPIPVAKT